jgi:hypothetical protein
MAKKLGVKLIIGMIEEVAVFVKSIALSVLYHSILTPEYLMPLALCFSSS